MTNLPIIHLDKASVGGGGSGIGYIGIFTNYNALIAAHPTAPLMTVAYVQNSQGTSWLPGGMGGNFYSKGTYLYDGANWVDGLDEVSDELQNLIDEQYKVNASSSDTTGGFLFQKLIQTGDLLTTINNLGGNETVDLKLTSKNKPITSNIDPTVNDDDSVANKHRIGQVWVNSITLDSFICKQLNVGAAIWIPLALDTAAEFPSDSILTPPQLTANVDDYDPTGWRDGSGNVQKRLLRMSSNGGTDRIRGLVPSTTASMNIVTIINVGTSGIVQVQNNNNNSLASNRFLLDGNNSLNPNEAATYYYDTTDLRWRAMNDWK